MARATDHNLPSVLIILLVLALILSAAVPTWREHTASSDPLSLSIPSRVPGVVVGDNSNYSVSVSWQTDNPTVYPNPFTGHSYSPPKDELLRVTDVSGSNVTSTATQDFANGTSTIITEKLDVGTQNLCFISTLNPSGWHCYLEPPLPSDFIASGLQAPDPIGSSPALTLNQTLTMTALGEQRTVNVFNRTTIDPINCIYIQGTTPCPNKTTMVDIWDQSSGMMINDTILETYTSSSGTAQARSSFVVVSTNVWSTPAPAPTTTISCSPETINVGEFTTCTVTVTPAPPSINFQVSTSSQTGFFDPSGSPDAGSCILTLGTCTLTYTDSSPNNATATILADYQGLVSFSLRIVRPSNVFNIQTSRDTIHMGAATANQAYTGVAVYVTGSSAPENWRVLFSTEDLRFPSPGTSPIDAGLAGGLSGVKYYDVALNGITDGSAKVCISYSSAGSATVMRYWPAGVNRSWWNATNVTVTGTTVCGNIPVSALTGTNIAVGNVLQNGPPAPFLSNILLITVTATIAITIVVIVTIVALRRRRNPPGEASTTPASILLKRSDEAPPVQDSHSCPRIVLDL